MSSSIFLGAGQLCFFPQIYWSKTTSGSTNCTKFFILGRVIKPWLINRMNRVVLSCYRGPFDPTCCPGVWLHSATWRAGRLAGRQAAGKQGSATVVSGELTQWPQSLWCWILVTPTWLCPADTCTPVTWERLWLILLLDIHWAPVNQVM